MISAKVIEHSSYNGNELISIEIQMSYFLDAEFETHGMICTNSSSNRAIPFKKMKDAEFYLPEDLRINEKGMQGFTKVHPDDIPSIHNKLTMLRTKTVQVLQDLENDHLLHKQHLNRYLTAFNMQTKIATANKYWWEKMLELRLDKDADPNMIQVAKAIEEAINNSKPRELKVGEWHLPYITQEERVDIERYDENPIATLCKVSAARCARTSYNSNVTGKLSTVEEDLKLFTRLVGGKIKHETPLEHQAKPIKYFGKHAYIYPDEWPAGVTHMNKDGSLSSGRLTHYVQFRHLQGVI